MKPKYESVLKLILLLIILYSSSFVSFAQTKKSRGRKAATDQTATTTVPVVTRAPDLSDAPLLTAPTMKDSIQNPLAPQLPKRHKVAIVPAPPPGQIPVYIPPKQ